MMNNMHQIQERTISVFMPMTIKKRGCAAMVILPKNAPREQIKTNYDHKLIKAFATAYKWQQSINDSEEV